MTRARRWLPGLRALLTIGRELAGIREQLTRIADAQEGITPAFATETAPLDPVRIAHAEDQNFALLFACEMELTQTLGRTPTEEEVCAYVDGLKPGDFPRLMRRSPAHGG